jgi:hypothetical protein
VGYNEPTWYDLWVILGVRKWWISPQITSIFMIRMHSFTGQTLLRRSAYAQQSVGSLQRPLMWYTERYPSALGGMWVLGALEMICYRRNGLATLTPAQIRSENCYGENHASNHWTLTTKGTTYFTLGTAT